MKAISRFSKSLALVAPVVASIADPLEAAAYIKFDGVDGEATDSNFEGYIKLDFFKVEIEGASAERQQSFIKDILIAGPIDKSSPVLMLACATGQILKDAEIVLTETSNGGEEVIFLKIEFTKVIVSSYNSTRSQTNNRPVEQMSLNFEEIKWTYSQFDEDGKKVGDVDTPNIPKSPEPR